MTRRAASRAQLLDGPPDTGTAWLAAARAMDPVRRKAIAEAVGFDQPGPRSYYALLPLAAINTAERWWIGAIEWPPPTARPSEILAWNPAGLRVLLWHPGSGDATIWRERQGLFGLAEWGTLDDALTVYTAPRAFLAAWVWARYEAYPHVWQQARIDAPCEPLDGWRPGVLAVGDIGRIAWPQGVRRIETFDAASAHAIQRTIERQANLPKVGVRTAQERRAA